MERKEMMGVSSVQFKWINSLIESAKAMVRTPVDTSRDVLRTMNINGIHMLCTDFANSKIALGIQKELEEDIYQIESISFEPGDVIIDIGANIGIVSIYMALKLPFVTIFAFEPIPENYRHLTRNIQLNNVTNIIPYPLAVTSDERPLDMTVNFQNSAGGTGNLHNLDLPRHSRCIAQSIRLDRVFQENNITHCKLLKIDCEGSEHEILLSSQMLDRVEYLSGEFHINSHLSAKGYSIESTITRCRQFIDAEKIRTTAIHMAE